MRGTYDILYAAVLDMLRDAAAPVDSDGFVIPIFHALCTRDHSSAAAPELDDSEEEAEAILEAYRPSGLTYDPALGKDATSRAFFIIANMAYIGAGNITAAVGELTRVLQSEELTCTPTDRMVTDIVPVIKATREAYTARISAIEGHIATYRDAMDIILGGGVEGTPWLIAYEYWREVDTEFGTRWALAWKVHGPQVVPPECKFDVIRECKTRLDELNA